MSAERNFFDALQTARGLAAPATPTYPRHPYTPENAAIAAAELHKLDDRARQVIQEMVSREFGEDES